MTQRQHRRGTRSAALPRGVQGAADPNFACAVRAFAQTVPRPPARRRGAGGVPGRRTRRRRVDRMGRPSGTGTGPPTPAPMVFSATKGMASTVIHRLADRGLIDYDAPVAEYWPEFGANGKGGDHGARADAAPGRAVPAQRRSRADLMDHLQMEERLAAAPVSGCTVGPPTTRSPSAGCCPAGPSGHRPGDAGTVPHRVAAPLRHRRAAPRPTAGRCADAAGPDHRSAGPAAEPDVQPGGAATRGAAVLGRLRRDVLPRHESLVQGDIPLLDSEIPAANGVATARALARMYGAIANGGRDRRHAVPVAGAVAELVGRPSLRPDRSMVMPLSFHLGYHVCRCPGCCPVSVTSASAARWAGPIRRPAWPSASCTTDCSRRGGGRSGRFRRDRRADPPGAALARRNGFRAGAEYGAPFDVPRPVAG